MIGGGEGAVRFRRFLFKIPIECFCGYTFGVVGPTVFSSTVTHLLFLYLLDLMIFALKTGFN
jgi:hypothetical protein